MLNQPNSAPRKLRAIERQACYWVRKLSEGRLTPMDAEHLKQWVRSDQRHSTAFVEARRRWDLMGAAGATVLMRNPDALNARHTVSPINWQRRAVLAGAVGAAAAVTGAAVLHPPMGLWPAPDEWRADIRTRTGERRRLALADDVIVELNTQTSIALHTVGSRPSGMELISGEAAVDLARLSSTFSVQAGVGLILASDAKVEVRIQDEHVCVTCASGAVRVKHEVGGEAGLSAGQQLAYNAREFERVQDVNLAIVSAWREGYLRFVEVPLVEVVSEINRYRPGRVLMVNDALAATPVTGRFMLSDLDTAITQIQQGLGMSVHRLPGGLVVLA